jgi:hypothetical protein
MHTKLASLIMLALAGSVPARARVCAVIGTAAVTNGIVQVADSNFNPTVARPAYVKTHPKVLFDEGHNNSYTSVGRYKPFADLITADGYKVLPSKARFSKRSLRGYDLLVIVNALGPQGHPYSSPFTEDEYIAVRDWVSAGGSLLLITDNAPFSAAVAELAKRFDVSLTNGYTVDTSKFNKEAGDQSELVFTREDSLLGDHPITTGRDGNERINRVLSFSGTSLKGPAGSIAFLKLSATALDVFPPDSKPTPDNPSPDHKTVSAAGRAQGLALRLGKGRVVVLGEAAMLTALVMPSGLRFGMSGPTDNRQLAINIVHWLSGLLK